MRKRGPNLSLRSRMSFFQGLIIGLGLVVIVGAIVQASTDIFGTISTTSVTKSDNTTTRGVAGIDYMGTGDVMEATQFNRVLHKLNSGKFLGVSAASDGSPGIAGGYDEADAACSTAFSGKARVCASHELLRAVASGSLPSGLSATQAWVNEGPPGYFAPVKDCDGWASTGGSEYGSIYSFYLSKALITECSNSIPFACCSK